MLVNRLQKAGLPRQPRNNVDDDDLIKDSDLFSKFDEFMKIKPKEGSNKSVSLIQVALCEKQTLFLTNSGELFGCGSSEGMILGKLLKANLLQTHLKLMLQKITRGLH